jgi:hypothetical protein
MGGAMACPRVHDGDVQIRDSTGGTKSAHRLNGRLDLESAVDLKDGSGVFIPAVSVTGLYR